MAALLGFELLDPTGTHGRLFEVARVRDRSGRTLLPVRGSLPEAHGPAHAVLDLLGIPARVALGVVTNENWLPERDVIGDGRDCLAGLVCVGGALALVG